MSKKGSTKQLSLVITNEDKLKLEELIEAKNTDTSKLVRKLIRDAHKSLLKEREGE